MASWTEGNGVTRADGNGTFHGFDIGGFCSNFFPNRRSPSIWEPAYGPAITTTTRHWWSAGQQRTQSEDGPEFILAIICMDTACSLMLARGKPQAGARCSLLCRCSGHLSSVAGLSSRARRQKIERRDRAGRGGWTIPYLSNILIRGT